MDAKGITPDLMLFAMIYYVLLLCVCDVCFIYDKPSGYNRMSTPLPRRIAFVKCTDRLLHIKFIMRYIGWILNNGTW